MTPVIEFKRGSLRKIKKPEHFWLGNAENDPQVEAQNKRESKILSKIYYQEETIPKYPSMEQMKKWNAREKQIIKGGSLAKYFRETLQKATSNDMPQTQDKGVLEGLRTDNFSGQPMQINGANKGGISFSSASPVNPQISFIGNAGPNPAYHEIGLLESSSIPVLTSNKDNSPQSNSNLSEESIQHVNYLKGLSKNYRTMPCNNYHASQGCGRGIFCHFIHLSEFEGTL